MGMGSVVWIGDTGMYGARKRYVREWSTMYGVDTRVATVSLHNDQPFFLNLPPLLYIIVIMSCCGSDTGYHCQQLKRANIL